MIGVLRFQVLESDAPSTSNEPSAVEDLVKDLAAEPVAAEDSSAEPDADAAQPKNQ